MHPHKITDGSTEQTVEIDQAARDQRAPVLGGDHHHVGIELFGGCAKPPGDISCAVHRLQVHAELAGSLFGFFQQAVARAVAAAGWSPEPGMLLASSQASLRASSPTPVPSMPTIKRL